MHVRLPTDWSAQEAMVIYDFVDAIRNQIFQIYRDDIEELCWQQCWDESVAQCRHTHKVDAPDEDFDDELLF